MRGFRTKYYVVARDSWGNQLLRAFTLFLGFSCGSAGKESACNAGDLSSIPDLGRSPGEGKGYLLQYSGLENSMYCIVHGLTNSRTRLSNFHITLFLVTPCCDLILHHLFCEPGRQKAVSSKFHISYAVTLSRWRKELYFATCLVMHIDS